MSVCGIVRGRVVCLCALVSIRHMRCVVPSAGFYIPQELTADTSYQQQLLGSLKWSDLVITYELDQALCPLIPALPCGFHLLLCAGGVLWSGSQVINLQP